MQSAKTDNSNLDLKLAVRRLAVKWSEKERPSVMECFAGEGHMYRNVWSHVASKHVGIDLRFSRSEEDGSGGCWRGDNLTLLPQAMDRGPWDIIDLDAYGTPWPLLRAVLRKAPAQPLVVTITCGMDRAMRAGASEFAALIAGSKSLMVPGVNRWYDDVIRWAVEWCQDGAFIRATHAARGIQRVAANGCNFMRYYVMRFAP